MIVVTSSTIAGKNIVNTVGLVKGNTIRARNVGKDILEALKHIVGGEIAEYTKLMAQSLEQAVDKMKAAAEEVGANAVTDVRFSRSCSRGSSAEILVYGTAAVVV